MIEYLFDNEFFQRRDIEELKSTSDSVHRRLRQTRRKNRDLKTEVAELEDQVASLALFNRTLLRMGIEKELWSAEEFTDLFRDLDLEDGVADGKVTDPGTQGRCPTCDREIPEDRDTCLYCGTEGPGA